LVGYLAISGFTALALALAWNRLQVKSKKIIFLLIYAAVMIAEYLGMLANPDKISISMELIQTFRILTALTIGMFWGILAVLFGSLCDRFTPTQNRAIAMV
jgi:Na+/melibiose symporter-like transporter